MPLFSDWMVNTAVNRDFELPAAAPQAAMPDEFTAIFTQHFRYLWCTLRRLGVTEGDLEDIAHDVWLRVHMQLAEHDPATPLRPWLFRIALGTASNYRRLARHRVNASVHPDDLRDPAPRADEHLMTSESSALVQRALQQVPLAQRAVLVLHDMDETPVPEIATALGIGLNTAYSRLRLGREAFRRALEQVMNRGGSK